MLIEQDIETALKDAPPELLIGTRELLMTMFETTYVHGQNSGLKTAKGIMDK